MFLGTEPRLRKAYTLKVVECIARREKLEAMLPPETMLRIIKIAEGDRGHSYESIFGQYLSSDVTNVFITDPYIQETFQICFLISFLELLFSKCEQLRSITLTTVYKNQEQENIFKGIKETLAMYNVTLDVKYSTTIHDREVK